MRNSSYYLEYLALKAYQELGKIAIPSVLEKKVTKMISEDLESSKFSFRLNLKDTLIQPVLRVACGQ